MPHPKPMKKATKSLCVVGAGGNIGSYLVSHLGRMPGVGRVVLIDRDVYEEKNLLSQDIMPDEVGRAKAKVQARRLRRVNPALDVVAIHDAVENVPLGRLRCDAILTGLDSRRARLYVNQTAWRLDVPWIDGGVEAGGLLARIAVYVPGFETPCLECAWDQRDYDALEQAYPCQIDGDEPAPTDAPSALGALVASLEVLECRKLVRNLWDQVAAGHQVLIDAAHHKHYLISLPRNPRCRFDHAVWDVRRIDRAPGEITIGQALDLTRGVHGGDGSPALRVEGRAFVRRLTCTSCGATGRLLRLRHRLRPSQRVCRRCGSETVAAGADMLGELDSARLSAGTLKRSLEALGFRTGDIFGVLGHSGEAHYEIADGQG